MSYELEGPIKLILDEQSFASGFRKREFVVTVEDGRYPQDIKLELVKEKIDLISGFSEGDRVKVSFDIRGNEYNGRYFVNLSAWKLEASGGEEAKASKEDRPLPEDTNDYGAEEDVPF